MVVRTVIGRCQNCDGVENWQYMIWEGHAIHMRWYARMCVRDSIQVAEKMETEAWADTVLKPGKHSKLQGCVYRDVES